MRSYDSDTDEKMLQWVVWLLFVIYHYYYLLHYGTGTLTRGADDLLVGEVVGELLEGRLGCTTILSQIVVYFR